MRTWASASATVASGPRITGSGVIIAPAVFSRYDISRRTSSASSGSISSSRADGGLRGQLGDQVGGVVGRHLLEHVGGPLVLEAAEDLDLVLLGQLLEDVGQPLVVEGGHDRRAPLGGQRVDGVGRVGGAHLVEGQQQLGRALAVVAAGQPLEVAPVDDVGLAAAAQPLGGLLHGDPAQHPVAVARLLHRHVVHGADDAGGDHPHLAVQHLPDHQGLGGALLEATHVEQAGGVHLPGVDVGDPGHRDEDPPPPEDLGDHAQHAGLVGLRADRHHEVAHLADLVAPGVEDRQSDQTGRVDAGGRGAHRASGYRFADGTRGAVRRESRSDHDGVLHAT